MIKLVLAMLVILSINSFAGADRMTELFHERMEQRYSHVNFKDFTQLEASEIPAEIQDLRDDGLEDLLQFARAYDLFEQGWKYGHHSGVYKVTTDQDEVVAYTFSILIARGSEVKTRRFYQASKRIDGVFFVERIAHYDY